MTNYFDKEILNILASSKIDSTSLNKIKNIIQSWVLHTDHIELMINELEDKLVGAGRAMRSMETEYGYQLDEAESIINKISKNKK